MVVDKELTVTGLFQFHLMYILLDTRYIKYIMYGLKTSKPDSALKNIDSLNVYKQPKYFPYIWKL